jgi:hypothetical protein
MSDSTIAFPTPKSPRCRPGELAGPFDAAPQPRLEGGVRLVDELSPAERDRMFAVLSRYFAHVTRRRFEADLAEKEWAILLVDGVSNRIQGFSTMMRLEAVVDEQVVVGLFSGDTIVEREYWGETLLPRLWSRHAFALAASLPGARVYWFLICSGYKTYRFLPVFFREFYPTFERPTPPRIKHLIDAFCFMKFPREYDPEGGVVRFADAAPLQPGVADVTEQRLRDPHVAFFAAANPGHARGDELACLVELVPENLSPAGRRMLSVPAEPHAR